jgi:hypothetical protein
MNHAGYLIAAIALLFGAPNGIPAAQAETIQLKAAPTKFHLMPARLRAKPWRRWIPVRGS